MATDEMLLQAYRVEREFSDREVMYSICQQNHPKIGTDVCCDTYRHLKAHSKTLMDRLLGLSDGSWRERAIELQRIESENEMREIEKQFPVDEDQDG